MNMNKKKSFMLLLACMFLFFLMRGVNETVSVEVNGIKRVFQETGEFRDDAATTPIKASVSVDRYPGLNSPVTITCEIVSTLDAPGTSARIELPENARLIKGSLTWNGDLYRDVPVTFSAKVKLKKEGNAAIFCNVLHQVDEKNSWGERAAVYLYVGKEEGSPGFRGMETRVDNPGEVIQAGTGMVAENGGQSPAAPRLSGSWDPVPAVELSSLSNSRDAFVTSENEAYIAGTITVTGRWGYYDRNDAYTGARDFLVELVRGDNGDHLAYTYTSYSGYYTFPAVTNPGGAGVRCRMLSYSKYSPYSDILIVVNPDWGTSNSVNNSFGTITPVTVFSDGTHDIGSWVSSNGSNYERAYWIQRDLVDTWRYIWFGAGSSQSPQETSGPCTVEWKIDSTHGTHYHRGGNVHLDGEDPLSDTVVSHEYGHNVMYTVYGNWMPTTYCPSPHYLQLSSHVNCAWTEGWATFLPLAVNNDPIYRWDSGATLNLELPTWGTIGWDEGDDVEGRVAGSLWDILDTANDGDDTYSDGSVANIWDTLYHQNDNNFSEFWSAWKSRGHNETGPLNCIFQNTIEYNPSPPFTVSISGPTKGDNRGTYTWCAYVSGGQSPYTYDWRYSYDGVNYNYLFGTTQCVTAQLPYGMDLYLKLTVTDSQGTEATDYHLTLNMDGWE